MTQYSEYTGTPLKRRASLSTRTTPQQHAHQPQVDTENDIGDDALYDTRLPTSTIRYRSVPTQQVFTQGNRRIVVHHEPPPRQKPRMHWLFFAGLYIFMMPVGWVSLTIAGNWWVSQQNTWAYGTPRTFQMDYVVGHNDSPLNPTHFIAVNVNRHIEIFEIPGGDPTKSKIYIGPVLFGDGQEQTPVTLSFKDVNGDGKPDMLVHVQEQTIVFINDNGQFRPLKQGEHISL